MNLPGLVITIKLITIYKGLKEKKEYMEIPEEKHKKIIAGAKYFYRLRPSQMNFNEFEKLMKYCKYIIGEDTTKERKLTEEEQVSILTTGEFPGQLPLPRILEENAPRLSKERLME